jgi:ribosome modulation factor
MNLTDVRRKEIQELGYKAFMGMFEESACPFKTDAERQLWTAGFNEAKSFWNRPYEKPASTPRPRNVKHQRYVRNGGRR